MDRADQIVHYYPRYRQPMKWNEGFMSLLLQMAALNSSTLFKNYTTNQKQKGIDNALKDFIYLIVLRK
jgi:hypothetical protein